MDEMGGGIFVKKLGVLRANAKIEYPCKLEQTLGLDFTPCLWQNIYKLSQDFRNLLKMF